MKSVFAVLTAIFILSEHGLGKVVDDRQSQFGIRVSADVYEAICWLEYLKTYIPQTRSLDFNNCQGQGYYQRNSVFRQRADEKYFGQFLLKYAMDKLPKEYLIVCGSLLLEDRFKTPGKKYGKVFNESLNAESYPYQAFAHCMLSIVHDKHGEFGLQQINERIVRRKDWAETMFERENEFRGVHTTPPLVYNDVLTQKAQKWAEQLARDCRMYHIQPSHPDYFLNGSRMGENLFTGDGIRNKEEDMALFGTNIWYEEIEYYPYPEYKGFGEEPFHKFAHFSQMIWKDTQKVGYGYAVNASENCGQYFIVARYFPPGNWYGDFARNILPRVHTLSSNQHEE